MLDALTQTVDCAQNIGAFCSSLTRAASAIISYPIDELLKSLAIRSRTPDQKAFYAHCLANRIRLPSLMVIGLSVVNNLAIRPGDTVLTSAPAERFKEQYRDDASAKLQSNLELAESIFQYVVAKVPHSSNYLSRTFKATDTIEEHMRYYSHLQGRCSGLELLQEIEKQGHGICEELAFVGAMHARQQYPYRKVECVSIGGGHHTFLIIGRKENSDPLDYKTWGKNSVICDIWAGKYYPTRVVEEELYDYINHFSDDIPDSDVSYPWVRPFDPRRQILLCRNINLSETPGMFAPTVA